MRLIFMMIYNLLKYDPALVLVSYKDISKINYNLMILINN